MDKAARKKRIDTLGDRLDGLGNDARYWDLMRTYGEYSTEVLNHLEACAAVQRAGANHT